MSTKMSGGLFLDATKARAQKMVPIERHRQEIADWVNQQTKHCAYIENENYDPSNVLKQTGQSMTSHELETRLKKILPPNAVFIQNDYRPTKRALILLTRSGPQTVCPFDRGLMPEHSILRVRTEELPDPEFVASPANRISRADLPKHEWNRQKREYEFDPTVTRPGFKRAKVCYGEDPEGGRGWRTVLIRCVQSGLCSVADVEREFGADNSPNWAGNLGKRPGLYLPW